MHIYSNEGSLKSSFRQAQQKRHGINITINTECSGSIGFI